RRYQHSFTSKALFKSIAARSTALSPSTILSASLTANQLPSRSIRLVAAARRDLHTSTSAVTTWWQLMMSTTSICRVELMNSTSHPARMQFVWVIVFQRRMFYTGAFMPRRNNSWADNLVLAPWWVSAALALLAYIMLPSLLPAA